MNKPISYKNRRLLKSDKPQKIKIKNTIKTFETGIYAIICKVNNGIYIGQSKCVKSRLKTHKFNLDHNKYFFEYPKWQKDYNDYKKESFDFITLEHCDEHELLAKETQYIRGYLRQGKDIYNKVVESENCTIINCNKEYSNVINKIIRLLEKGSISIQDLENGLNNV